MYTFNKLPLLKIKQRPQPALSLCQCCLSPMIARVFFASPCKMSQNGHLFNLSLTVWSLDLPKEKAPVIPRALLCL
jgi:hypothetical protein